MVISNLVLNLTPRIPRYFIYLPLWKLIYLLPLSKLIFKVLKWKLSLYLLGEALNLRKIQWNHSWISHVYNLQVVYHGVLSNFWVLLEPFNNIFLLFQPTPYLPVLGFLKSLFHEIGFLSISNLIFAGYTGSINQIEKSISWNRDFNKSSTNK